MRLSYLLIIFFCGCLIGLFFAFYITRTVPSPLLFHHVSIVTINDKPAIVVSVDEHPPWAHSHFYSINFKYADHAIDVTELYMPWHPFSAHVFGRTPIVIQQGLLTGSYAIRLWNGYEYLKVGDIVVNEKGDIEWIPK